MVDHISQLKFDKRNPRKRTQRNLKVITDSLQEVGAARSIVIDEDDSILAGNGVVEAAALAGIEKVIEIEADGNTIIAVRRRGLTEEQRQKLKYYDNRSAMLADWDVEVILADMESGLDLSQLWQGDELAAMLEEAGSELLKGADNNQDTEPQVDKAKELQKKWGTEVGQVWQLGEHRLAVGDCTDKAVVEAVMRGEKVQACITDPPYGINWDTDYTRFTTGFDVPRTNHRPIENDDKPFDPIPFLGFEAVVLWGANFYADKLPIGTWLIWDKRFTNGEAMLSDAELAWMKGGYGVYIHSLTSQGFVRPEKIQHPTQKPVRLFEWCIEKSKAKELIFDPFLGSGTTLIACHNLNRKCRATEIDPGYAAVALERFLTHTSQQPTRLTG